MHRSKSNPNNNFPTVFDAIKSAGGITTYSDISSIEIIRKDTISNGGGRIKTSINFFELLNNGDTSQNIRLLDEDVIRIRKNDKPITSDLLKAVRSNLNPKNIKVFVGGRVEQPGIIFASKTSSLNESIALAGGAKFVKSKINLIRYNSDGTIVNKKFYYRRNAEIGSQNNPRIKNGDIIYVGKSPLNIANEIISELTQPFIGGYSAIRVIEDIVN